MAEELCAHSECRCEVEGGTGVTKDGKTYCSEFCASGEGANPEECECGHPDCD